MMRFVRKSGRDSTREFRHVEGLTLYEFPGCAFCGRVDAALRDLGLKVRRADIHLQGDERARLQRATGKTTVPVLRIHHDEGERWLSDSSNIVRYLYAVHGSGATPPLRIFVTPAHVVLALALAVFAVSQLWCSAAD